MNSTSHNNNNNTDDIIAIMLLFATLIVILFCIKLTHNEEEDQAKIDRARHRLTIGRNSQSLITNNV